MSAFRVAGFFLALSTFLRFAAEENEKVKARLEVKAFIREDSEKYPDLEVEYIGGIDPIMVFFKKGEEIERIPISEKSQNEINQLLASHGLSQRADSNEEEVPEGNGVEEPTDKEPVEETEEPGESKHDGVEL